MTDFWKAVDDLANDAKRSEAVRTAAARCRNRRDDFHAKHAGDPRLKQAEPDEEQARQQIDTFKKDGEEAKLIAALHRVEDRYFALFRPQS